MAQWLHLRQAGRAGWGFEVPRKPQAEEVETFQTMRCGVTRTHCQLVHGPGNVASPHRLTQHCLELWPSVCSPLWVGGCIGHLASGTLFPNALSFCHTDTRKGHYRAVFLPRLDRDTKRGLATRSKTEDWMEMGPGTRHP